MTVPINIRKLQLSVRDNVLVNQSVRHEFIGAGSGAVENKGDGEPYVTY
jgi:hypothetical protein